MKIQAINTPFRVPHASNQGDVWDHIQRLQNR